MTGVILITCILVVIYSFIYDKLSNDDSDNNIDIAEPYEDDFEYIVDMVDDDNEDDD